MNPIETLIARLRAQLPNAAFDLDAPDDPQGAWFLDIVHAGHAVTMEWRPDQGFGVSAPAGEAGYGEGPEETLSDIEQATTRALALLTGRSHTVPPREVWLRDLRALSDLTQAQLAANVGVQQAAISKLEARRDTTLSTLRRYIEALGGRLEIIAHIGDEQVRLTQFNGEAALDEAPEPASR